MPGKRVVIYLRVSSKQQDVKSQEPDLKRWALANGVDYAASVVRETFTGKSMDRPKWDKVAARIAAGEVDELVVWRLDRLGRTAKGMTALIEDLVDAKVNLVSLKEGINLATAAGRMMANVLASIAAYETEMRAERVLAGQAAARAAGKTWGGWEPGKRRSVTDEQVAAVRAHKADGKRPTWIARATGVSRNTVYRILDGEGAVG